MMDNTGTVSVVNYKYVVDTTTIAFKKSIEKLKHYLDTKSEFKVWDCSPIGYHIVQLELDGNELKLVDVNEPDCVTSYESFEELAKNLWIISAMYRKDN